MLYGLSAALVIVAALVSLFLVIVVLGALFSDAWHLFSVFFFLLYIAMVILLYVAVIITPWTLRVLVVLFGLPVALIIVAPLVPFLSFAGEQVFLLLYQTVASPFILGIPGLLIPGAAWIGRRVWNLARATEQRLIETEAIKANKSDRQYCLYLRSFRADNAFFIDRQFRLRSLLSALSSEGFARHEPLEEVVRRELAGVLQLVAIGKPQVFTSVPGFTTADEDWQALFKELVGKASVIVVVPLATTGTKWELQQLAEAALERTLIVLPPYSLFASGDDYSRAMRDKYAHQKTVSTSSNEIRSIDPTFDQAVFSEVQRWKMERFETRTEPSLNWLRWEWDQLAAYFEKFARLPEYSEAGYILSFEDSAEC